MQKIMFNDKYCLTDSVLAKRKTQTRRIITNKEMLEIIKKFDSPASLFLVYDRFVFNPDLRKRFINNRKVMRYQMNETVAIAQSYADITPQADWANCMTRKEEIGWNNKMFVCAEDMPHHIRITKIRIERLQEISDEDCIAEGIWKGVTYWYHGLANSPYRTAKEAYAALIDKISGKGTWKNNPYVFVYDFELSD
ncbi:hypothetical protein [Prevotella sp.]|uniref:hypothetical protein n=1 Tax=Prevotella sp. TaxID=59823 RepID=UPI0030778818